MRPESMNHFDLHRFKMSRLPSESELLAGWGTEDLRPLVSIVCTAYNHESYIDDAILGFLLQKTDFPFEIIICDDASPDQTARIIDRFQINYPRIIKFQANQKNQYSQGSWPLLSLFALAKGDYIAVCEGDDYWISPTKLQQQVDALRRSPDVQICIHAALSEFTGKERAFRPIGVQSPGVEWIPAQRVIEGGGGFCATASIMLRASFARSLPEWVSHAPVLDLFLQGLAANENGLIFLPELMCVYRVDTESSWTRKVNTAYLPDTLLASYESAFMHYDMATGRRFSREVSLLGARMFLSGAISSIRFRRPVDFRRRIERSVELSPEVSFLQATLYRLRPFFSVLRAAYVSYKAVVYGSSRLTELVQALRRPGTARIQVRSQ